MNGVAHRLRLRISNRPASPRPSRAFPPDLARPRAGPSFGGATLPTRPRIFRPRPQQPRQVREREADQRRGSARSRGYDSRWDKASASHRREHPLCAYCEAGVFGPARVKPADLTDHLYPHRQFEGVFWLKALWVSCCHECHSGPKQALERQGRAALDRLARQLGRPALAEALPGGVAKV